MRKFLRSVKIALLVSLALPFATVGIVAFTIDQLCNHIIGVLVRLGK
jgi:hypothetical protein